MKYRFEVTYECPEYIQINDFMKNLDLAIERICHFQKVEIYTNKDEQETNKVKNTLKAAFESEGYIVHDIVGGVWE